MARVVVMLIVLLMPVTALAMAPTQFGTYSQAYLDRQALKKCKAEAKAEGRADTCKPAPKDPAR